MKPARRHEEPLALALVAALAGVACGPPPPPAAPRDEDLRSLTETRALEIVREALAERGVPYEAGWSIDIGYDEPLEVDLRLTGTLVGIEWVSAEDRARLGDRVPEPAEGDQLRVLPGAREDAAASVLVLDHVTYRYDPERERVERGATGAREVESRLRRDVVDFLEYARAQASR